MLLLYTAMLILVPPDFEFCALCVSMDLLLALNFVAIFFIDKSKHAAMFVFCFTFLLLYRAVGVAGTGGFADFGGVGFEWSIVYLLVFAVYSPLSFSVMRIRNLDRKKESDIDNLV